MCKKTTKKSIIDTKKNILLEKKDYHNASKIYFLKKTKNILPI